MRRYEVIRLVQRGVRIQRVKRWQCLNELEEIVVDSTNFGIVSWRVDFLEVVNHASHDARQGMPKNDISHLRGGRKGHRSSCNNVILVFDVSRW